MVSVVNRDDLEIDIRVGLLELLSLDSGDSQDVHEQHAPEFVTQRLNASDIEQPVIAVARHGQALSVSGVATRVLMFERVQAKRDQVVALANAEVVANAKLDLVAFGVNQAPEAFDEIWHNLILDVGALVGVELALNPSNGQNISQNHGPAFGVQPLHTSMVEVLGVFISSHLQTVTVSDIAATIVSLRAVKPKANEIVRPPDVEAVTDRQLDRVAVGVDQTCEIGIHSNPPCFLGSMLSPLP